MSSNKVEKDTKAGALQDTDCTCETGGALQDTDCTCETGGALVIGLTGGIGTGKSTAAKYLLEAELPAGFGAGGPTAAATGPATKTAHDTGPALVHVDADAISRQLTVKEPGVTNPVLEEIRDAFEKAGAEENSAGDAVPEDTSVSEGASVPEDDAVHVLREDGSLDRATMASLVFADPEKKKLLEDILFRHIIREIHRQIDEAGKAGRPVLLDVPLLFESGLDSLCDYVIALSVDEDVRIGRVVARDGCNEEDVRARIRNQMSDEERRARADFVVENSGSREELFRQLDEVLADIGASSATQ